jgi:NADH-quinone oxidoreductase subunit L
MGVSVAIAVIGILLAYRMYVQRPEIPERLARNFKPLYKLLWNKWYVDEAYEGAVVKPIWGGSKSVLHKGVDKGLIDGALHGMARVTGAASEVVRKIQTGIAQQYVILFMVGLLAILGWLVIR